MPAKQKATSDTSNQVVVLPFEAWREFTWELIRAAFDRNDSETRADIKAVLDIEALAQYGTPGGGP